jgi:hypothetical protein
LKQEEMEVRDEGRTPVVGSEQDATSDVSPSAEGTTTMAAAAAAAAAVGPDRYFADAGGWLGLAQSPSKGRYLVARRPIPAGQDLLLVPGRVPFIYFIF